MESHENSQVDSKKMFSPKVDSFLFKPLSRNILISILILFFLLLSFIFIQDQQDIRQWTAQAQGTPNPCSNVPYYCLINGGGNCNVPSTCPISPVAACVPPVPINLIVHFDFALFDIKTIDMPALDSYAEALKKDPTTTVTIAGNTDSVGTEVSNKTLSQSRAQSVKNYLVSKGASANKYTVVGYGETQPVAPNTNPNDTDNPAGRALNRRAELTAISGSKTCPIPSTQPKLQPSVQPQPSISPKQQITCTDNNGNEGYGGYTFSPPQNANTVSISTQWNVVSTTCSAGANGFSVWPGIQTNDILVQAGSYDFCSPDVSYFAWTMAYPGPWVNPPQNDEITPGDIMNATITMTSKGQFTTLLKDITKGWSFSTNSTDPGFTSLLITGAGQILIEDEGTQNAPLVPFSSDVMFTNSQYSINGSVPTPLASAPILTCLNIARNGTTLEQTSNVNGGSFNETWKHL